MDNEQSQSANISNAPVASPQPPAEPDTISVNRAEYDAMQEQLNQARQTFEVLNPHSARLERLVKDQYAAQLFDDALQSYDDLAKRRAPKVDENVRPIFEKVSKLEKFVDDMESRRLAEEERPQREFQAKYNEWQNAPSNNRFFQRLMSDHPDLKPRDIQYLAQVAAESNFEPLEATWKKESWRFEKPGAVTPPTSLRADTGEVGSTPSVGGGQEGPTMRQRIIELERARRGLTA